MSVQNEHVRAALQKSVRIQQRIDSLRDQKVEVQRQRAELERQNMEMQRKFAELDSKDAELQKQEAQALAEAQLLFNVQAEAQHQEPTAGKRQRSQEHAAEPPAQQQRVAASAGDANSSKLNGKQSAATAAAAAEAAVDLSGDDVAEPRGNAAGHSAGQHGSAGINKQASMAHAGAAPQQASAPAKPQDAMQTKAPAAAAEAVARQSAGQNMAMRLFAALPSQAAYLSPVLTQKRQPMSAADSQATEPASEQPTATLSDSQQQRDSAQAGAAAATAFADRQNAANQEAPKPQPYRVEFEKQAVQTVAKQIADEIAQNGSARCDVTIAEAPYANTPGAHAALDVVFTKDAGKVVYTTRLAATAGAPKELEPRLIEKELGLKNNLNERVMTNDGRFVEYVFWVHGAPFRPVISHKDLNAKMKQKLRKVDSDAVQPKLKEVDVASAQPAVQQSAA